MMVSTPRNYLQKVIFSFCMNTVPNIIKLIIVGDNNVGKSSLVTCMTGGVFTEAYIATICTDFAIKTVISGQKEYRIQIWDTAGQERFHAITTAFYRGAHVIMICFSLADKKTFDHIDYWIGQIRAYCPEGEIIFVGTKADLPNEVTFNDINRFKNYVKTSSKNGDARDLLMTVVNLYHETQQSDSFKLTSGSSTKSYGCKC